MDAELRIGTDPAVWYLAEGQYDRVAAALAQAGAPLTAEVVAPLAGTVVLNPRAAGSVVLRQPVRPVGWNPSGIYLPRSPLLYLASSTGPTHSAPGYTLAAGYTLGTLERDIIGAMTSGSMLTISLESGPSGTGMVALSGATLSYAVLCPVAAKRS